MSGRKETVLDLAKFIDKGVQVKLTGGRQVTGTLKGYDQLLNLVLDEAVEFLRGLKYNSPMGTEIENKVGFTKWERNNYKGNVHENGTWVGFAEELQSC